MLHRNFILLRLMGCPNPFASMANESADPPDYTPVANANKEVAELQMAQADKNLAFQKEQYADLKPYVQAQLDQGLASANTQNAIMQQNADYAAAQRAKTDAMFDPVKQQMVKESMDYGGAADQSALAQSAAANVDAQFDAQRSATQRNLTSMGVNPNSGKFVSSDRALGIAQAGQRAAQQTAARQTAKDKGISLRAGAANYGAGLGNASANAYNTAVGAGSAAAGSAGAGIGGANQSAAGVSNAYGGYNNVANTMMQGNQMAMSGLNTIAGVNQANAQGTNQLIGTAAGLGLLALSSKDAKEGKAPVSEEQVLDRIKDVPVESWKYKDGMGDGGSHIGPYAEDVQASLGDAVAPGGKAIDMVSMQGAQLAAIKALDKKVSALQKRVDGKRRA